MRFAFFYHSARSDWNHGNAHFLRGLVRSLTELGHTVGVLRSGPRLVGHEPGGRRRPAPPGGVQAPLPVRRRPPLRPASRCAALERRLEPELGGVDVVVLHEWPAVEQPALLQLLLRLRRRLWLPPALPRHPLPRPDPAGPHRPPGPGALRRHPGLQPFARRHLPGAPGAGAGEGARGARERRTTPSSAPCPPDPHRPLDDALFVGNWGGPDRASELRAFFFRPARRLRAERRFALYGVRYPPEIAARAPASAAGSTTAAGCPITASRRPSPRPGPCCTSPAGSTRGCSTARPRSASSRCWPAPRPWSAPPGRTPTGCSGPARTTSWRTPRTDGGGPGVAVAGRGRRRRLGRSGRERILARAHLPPPRGADAGHRRRPARGGRPAALAGRAPAPSPARSPAEPPGRQPSRRRRPTGRS